ncbi:MAG: molecular chaperone DjlA [Xanthomarina sp.]|uniref:Molecular chaperone DjlA n=1 Tax=Xanthomarina gelatinilytica TaxID=1137281 RepID=A0A3D6BPZ3_9FLAO|nr:TerB family tellurite resistance protein [Xanthomarina sp.]MDX1317705.1 TerB family tellurite resistance protein [Xanthomarina gelatinilytica]MAL22589.1 molecular chaperone DjlA [Xanthomarina sp.]MBF61132.1 molecular chaperone DjlA [Xanthomarina sp.]HAI17624.1 molecular chaperone DjlA [Xanthomarina gelatinilytica]HCY81243.1 molecular chaperone DjlA [Xanthomarina gelatinilytica]|tara:strand:- start:1246 stop:1983 length:738 start_codon:yes stop_codon:yes gene_type:complete
MSFSKWIGAAIGWSLGGPIGAILGMALGSVVDGFSNGSIKVDTQNPYARRRQTKSGDFEVSLLILSSIVIKADGKQDQRELDFVRQQFVGMYGKERANHAFKLFKGINKQDIPTRQVCLQIRQMMDHPSRLQLLHFLFGIAKADGIVLESEVSSIQTIANYLGISHADFESIKAMFYNSSDNAYKILEISKQATVTEIKAAYRKMAKKYHPDKVVHLGKEHQKGAEEKFRQVQAAYEQLQKERGF